MRTRRHEVGVDLAVSFDDEKGTIIVSRYVRPVPHFHGDWQDVATFTKEKDWYTSEYQNQIVGDGNVAKIAWFWQDLTQSNQTPA